MIKNIYLRILTPKIYYCVSFKAVRQFENLFQQSITSREILSHSSFLRFEAQHTKFTVTATHLVDTPQQAELWYRHRSNPNYGTENPFFFGTCGAKCLLIEMFGAKCLLRRQMLFFQDFWHFWRVNP